jgi:hypothetical protein
MNVFLLEEPSIKVFLEVCIERFFPTLVHSAQVKFISFEGKHDMKKQLSRFIRNYKRAFHDTRFIILMDQDNKACTEVKATLSRLSKEGGDNNPLIRIVCQSLESWYLGDLSTVQELTHIKLSHLQEKKRFREPDATPDPKQTLKAYIKHYPPINFAKEFAGHFTPERNKSHSFQVLYASLNELFSQNTSGGAH